MTPTRATRGRAATAVLAALFAAHSVTTVADVDYLYRPDGLALSPALTAATAIALAVFAWRPRPSTAAVSIALVAVCSASRIVSLVTFTPPPYPLAITWLIVGIATASLVLTTAESFERPDP